MDGQLLIKSLASASPHYEGRIGKVELLGANSEVKWTRDADGLRIRVPHEPPCHYAYAFKILPA
jgi:hypothetical protein